VAKFPDWPSAYTGIVVGAGIGVGSSDGVFRTAQVLRLDYTKRKRCTPETSVETPKSASQPAFVELIATPTTHPCECTIEVEGPRGRMRIEWKGSTAPDLAGLSRMLGEPGA
jgi:hypothetical protein